MDVDDKGQPPEHFLSRHNNVSVDIALAVAYLKATGNDWLARMTGPISLILLFAPLAAPALTAKYLGGSTLVWIPSFICLVVSTFRAWLAELNIALVWRVSPIR
jgi:hypothetical protein